MGLGRFGQGGVHGGLWLVGGGGGEDDRGPEGSLLEKGGCCKL
jgi:hypothetical protein